ncbi:hypothetical protein NMG60_11025485 [Bertholletia excelsa]
MYFASFNQCYYLCLHGRAGKSSWPELVGKNGDFAKKVVEKENPCVRAEILTPDITGITWDFKCSRVRISVDEDYTVLSVPVIG